MLTGNGETTAQTSPLREASPLACPCGYSGVNFEYVETVELVSPIQDGVVRLDKRQERRDPGDDVIRCPECGHQFPASEEAGLKFETGD